MASPADPNHPLTPPAESTQHTTTTTTQPTQTTTMTTTTTTDPSARVDALLNEPLTSLQDDGSSKRPRDARLIHLLLAAYGVSAYQERVPIQLMDFAYRYTSAVLGDALHIQAEGYDQAETTKRGRAKANDDGDVSIAALRMSIQSRLGYQLSSSLPKEFLKGLADEKNRIALGPAVRDTTGVGPLVGGVRLPHERHVLTGMGWGLKEEWESDGEESVEEMQMDQDDENENEGMEDEDEEGAGRMEDVFGEETKAGADGDTEMQS